VKRLFFLVVAAGLAAGMICAVGCSDDDEDSNPIISGDPDSPSFEIYDNTIAEVPGSVAEMSLHVTFSLIDWQFSTQGARHAWTGGHEANQGEIDSISWTYANGWNIFYFEMSEFSSESIPGGGTLEDSLWITGWDSLQFLEDGTAVPTPSDTTDSLYSRQHVTVTMRSSDGEVWDITGHHRLTITNYGLDQYYGPILGLDLIAVDSIEALLVDPDDNVCDLTLVTSATLADAIMPMRSLGEGCPSWGSLAATQTVALSCGGGTATDSIAFDGSWHLTENFVNGVAHQSLTFGNFLWTSVDTCGISLSETR
jgi:hypothetical protein